MLVEYVGRMGSFLYDDSEFHVECAGTAEEHLQYIGKGNSVEIPVGIKTFHICLRTAFFLRTLELEV